MIATPRAVSLSALAALLLAAVWVLWPLGLGGDAVYVTTHGISMQPRFHTGDLAILRAADHYSVGDVVAYRSVSLNTTVMHRIVALDGDHFVIKGDNNSWLDQDKPTSDFILGRLWLRVPQGGKALTAIRSPGALALIAVAVLGLLWPLAKPRGRHGGHRRRRGARAWSMPTRAFARQAALASAVVAILAAVGGTVLMTMSETQTVTHSVSVTHRGQFSYTGTAMQGTTYPTGRIGTGDPIYTKLSRDLTVSFQDTFRGGGLSQVHGTVRLVVSVASADGWTADVDSGPVATVQNGTATASIALHPNIAAALLARHNTEVGTIGNGATLLVAPRISVAGTVAGRTVAASSLPALSFPLGSTALRPSVVGAPSLAPTLSTSVPVVGVTSRHFMVVGAAVAIGVARLAVGVLLVLALAILAISAWIGRSRPGDPADDFLMKNAARILPVTRFTPGNTVIDVSDAAALHRVAERLDSLVLHQVGPDDHMFAVQDVETTYRFVLPIAPGDETRRLRPVPVGNDEARRLRPVVLGDDTRRLRPVAVDDDETTLVRPLRGRRVPVPAPVRPVDRTRRAAPLPPLPTRPRSRVRSDIGDLGAMFG